MKAKNIVIALLLLLLGAAASAQVVSIEKAAQLAEQFLPDPVRMVYTMDQQLKTLQDPLQQLQYSARTHCGMLNYLAFQMPGDAAQYVLLAWGDGPIAQAVYFRLLKSQDGGQTFVVAQDFPFWYGPLEHVGDWTIRLQDLTADGVPELLFESGDDGLIVFAWHNGGFTCITPIERGGTGPGVPSFDSAFFSAGGVELVDADGDGKAEVVVYAWANNEPNYDAPNPLEDWDTVYYGTTKIYKYDGTTYVLWKELPPDDKYPLTVPSFAVIHPGTIPISELSSPGKGDLQVFISHPAGTNTVDDIDAASLTFQGTPLSFKKRWANQKQPDTTSANWEWEGCPVKQTASSGQGEWNPSPEDPYLPSPDGKTEYHFVAPYLEFRLSRSAVFPYLLEQARAAFQKEPSRQAYFIDIPVSGKMKNGKLAAISALVCIKNTGNPAKSSAPEAVAAPAKGK